MGLVESKIDYGLFNQNEYKMMEHSFKIFSSEVEGLHFPSPLSQKKLQQLCIGKDEKITFELYKTMVLSLTKGNSSETLLYICDSLTSKADDEEMNLENLVSFLSLVYNFAVIKVNKSIVTNETLSFNGIASSFIPKGKSSIRKTDFVNDMNRSYPWMYRVISTYFSSLFLSSEINALVLSSFQIKEKSKILSKEQIFLLSLVRQPLCTQEWSLLYDPSIHGLSFNRLCYHIENYGGPTLLVFKDTNGYIFGGYASSPWKEANDFYGDSDCFLFSCFPSMNIFNPETNSGSRRNYMYLNKKGYSLAHGIGFGGKLDNWRIFIDEDMEKCKTTLGGLTYERGPLSSCLPNDIFHIDNIEIWGLGGEEAITKQNAERAMDQVAINKARKVDKLKLLGDGGTDLLFSKTFAHKGEVQGEYEDRLQEKLKDKEKS